MNINKYLLKDTQENTWKYFLGFFIIGILNNNAYVLVQSASDDLARHFHQSSFMGLFLFGMILFGAISRYIYGRHFVRIRHLHRILLITILSIISFLAIAAACFYSSSGGTAMFWVAVTASIFTGTS